MNVYDYNAAIFAENLRLFAADPALRAAVAAARAGTVLVRAGDPLPDPPADRQGGAPARVFVSGKRSFQAAAGYRDRKVCVLNFASAFYPGGGVEAGAAAQEEALCRCSTLWPCLATDEMWAGFYLPHRRAADPLGTDDCIYSPGVTVFRADDAAMALLPEAELLTVDVLTCAAPDVSDTYCPEQTLRGLLLSRARRILALAAARGAEALVRGAFGCGVFANPPRLVAEAFRAALADFGCCFETVEFAVHSAPDRPTPNYLAFREVFG